ncbi:MAG: DinB family protein [Caldilineaceae bacterium]|nr:DinB family protein [Caldilineaceae bacterium]
MAHNFTDLTQVAAALRSTPHVLRALLLPLDDAAHTWRPEADAWCAKEVIGHLIETDRSAFRDRIELMTGSPDPVLGGLDIHGLVTTRRDVARPVAALLDELAAQRGAMADLVTGLTPADLARTAPYPKHNKVFSVADFVYEWPFHDAAHIKQILDLLQRQYVPHMGPAMRAAVGHG